MFSLHVRTFKSHASLRVVIEWCEIMQEKRTTSVTSFVYDKRTLVAFVRANIRNQVELTYVIGFSSRRKPI